MNIWKKDFRYKAALKTGHFLRRCGLNPRFLRQVCRLRMWILILALILGVFFAGLFWKGKESEQTGAVLPMRQTELMGRLYGIIPADAYVQKVRMEAKTGNYPEDIAGLLDKNPETAGFVDHYPEKKDQPPADTIGEDLEQGGIPLLLQWDERWGYAPYGNSVVAVSGCGPTCMAMVASGLNGDPSITPAKTAEYSSANGYLDEDNNTYWAFMEEACANWNLAYEAVMNEEAAVAAQLQAGHPIICSMGPGYFTQNGHFIVLTGYENGMITINDPFSKSNSEAEWTFAQIKGQIKAMWAYRLK